MATNYCVYILHSLITLFNRYVSPSTFPCKVLFTFSKNHIDVMILLLVMIGDSPKRWYNPYITNIWKKGIGIHLGYDMALVGFEKLIHFTFIKGNIDKGSKWYERVILWKVRKAMESNMFGKTWKDFKL